MAETTANLVKKFIKLDQARRKHEDAVKSSKTEIAALEAELLKRFEQSQTQRMNVAGVTVYVQSQLWASAAGGDKLAASSALKEAGLGDMVEETFNTQRLSAYVREQRDEIQERLSKEKGEKVVLTPEELLAHLPEPLRMTLAVSEVYHIKSRKGD